MAAASMQYGPGLASGPGHVQVARVHSGLRERRACLGLTWFTASTRATGRHGPSDGEPAPSFSTRMVILHGGAAAATLVLAALTALVLGR